MKRRARVKWLRRRAGSVVVRLVNNRCPRVAKVRVTLKEKFTQN